MAFEIPELVYAFGSQLNAFMSVEIFVVSCSSLSEVRQLVLNLGMSRFISLTKLCSAVSFTKTSQYSTVKFNSHI